MKENTTIKNLLLCIRDRDSQKIFIFWAVAIVLVFSVFINSYDNDIMHSNIKADDFKIADKMVEDEVFIGNLYESNPLFFPKGSYEITINYNTGNENNYIELIDTRHPGVNNEPYQKLYSDMHSEDNTFNVTFDASAGDVKLRVGCNSLQVENVTIKSIGTVYNDSIFLAVGLLCIFVIIFYLIQKNENNVLKLNSGDEQSISNVTVILICALSALITTAPMMKEFLSGAHDINMQLTRIEGLAQGMLAGQLPVRIDPAFIKGQGYAAPVMNPSLFLYIPAFMRLCGISMLVSYQVFCFLINLLTALLTYHCINKMCKSRTIGIITSCLYTLSLYRMINIYTRGALGEFIAMAFLPCLIYGIYTVLYDDSKQYKWLVIGATGIIQSHIPSIIMSVIFYFAFAIPSIKQLFDKKRIIALVKATVVIVLINLWFIVPFLAFSQLNLNELSSSKDISGTAVYLVQLFATFITSRGVSLGFNSTAGEMPLSIGGVLSIGLIIFLIGLKYSKDNTKDENDKHIKNIGIACLALSLFALFIVSNLFPWKAIQQAPFIGKLFVASTGHFAWRYLGLASIFTCITAAIGIHRVFSDGKANKNIKIILTVLAVSIIALSPYIDSFIQDKNQGTALDNKFSDFNKDHVYGGQYYEQGTNISGLVNSTPDIKFSDSIVPIQIKNYKKSYTNITFNYEGSNNNEVSLTLPLYNYPGYSVLLNGSERLETYSGDNHLLALKLPQKIYSGSVSVVYKGLWYFRIADIISLISVLVIVEFYLLSYLKKRKIDRSL